MNILILTGNVCSMFDNNTNMRITIADNFKEKTDYIKVTLFGNQMNFAKKYVKIGDHIAIQGRITTYKDNAGKEIMGIVANNISFEGYKNPKKENNEEDKENFIELGETTTSEEDLPFWKSITMNATLWCKGKSKTHVAF